LEAWADRLDSQAVLPELVRRLVHATAAGVTRVSFAAGEGIQLAGWDGIVITREGTAFVPEGTSGWEIGTNKRIREKANEDYSKRRFDPRGVVSAEGAFVFVTPRRWATKDEWVAERQSDGVWREVRAYTADDLEAWLQQAPAVHIWLSALLGKRPDGVSDIGTYWADWSAATRPALTPDFVLAGRGETVTRIHKWLREDAGTLALQAESREEALAVFAAAILQLPIGEQVAHLARAVVIDNRTAWDHLAISEESLILVPLFESRDAHARATRRGHRVVVPLGRSDSTFATTLVIPPVAKDEGTKALVALGLSPESAADVVTLARRSLTACRRILALSPEVQQPEWARPSEARPLLPMMLAGAWNGNVDEDRDAIGKLAQAPYREITSVLARWSNETDSPIRRVGDVWFIVSREDSWLLLARYLVRDDLQRFEEIVLHILGTPDPRFDLPEKERWMAAVTSRGTQYSDVLREGISETLAFLGARGDVAELPNGLTPGSYSGRVVRRLFDLANRDWRVWASLSKVLPLLGEAAPGVFLSAVEDGMQGERPILRLFGSESEPLFSSSPHTGLLWALETIAWDPAHLGHASVVLARLAKVDPGGKLQNRPANSLREIFLLWHPNTAATLEQRMIVLDTVRRAEPEVAWHLLRELLPKSHDVGHESAKPRWRDWAPESVSASPVTVAEHVRAVHEVVARVLEDVGRDGARWSDVVDALASLPADDYRAVVQRLAELDLDGLSQSDRGLIWNSLRDLVSRHRSFATAQWALPRPAIESLAGLLPRFEPEEIAGRYGWLFGFTVRLLDGGQTDHGAYEGRIAEERREAVRRIGAQHDLQGLLELSMKVREPFTLGVTVGETEVLQGAREDEVLSAHLGSVEQAHAAFAEGFVTGRLTSLGRAWAEAKLRGAAREWGPRRRAALAACLPPDGDTWALVEQFDRETQAEYWQRVYPYRISRNGVDVAVRRFVEHGRPFSGIELLWFHREGSPPVPAELIADVLEAALRVSWKDMRVDGSLALHVSELLDQLEASGQVEDARLAALEWNFLPLVGRHERPPRVLHRALAEDPEFFARVVSYVFRAEGEEPAESSEEDQARARLGYELLESWVSIPGAVGSEVDSEALRRWVQRARSAHAAGRRVVIGDERIGQMLANAPPDADGAWPHRAVRDVIEEVASPAVERGLQIGLFNKRGVTSRSFDAGGRQERQLAEQYTGFAVALADRWPRTAQALREIADGYREEAHRWDQEVAVREERGAGPARIREREWIRSNVTKLGHLAGKWVAVEGSEIVAQGDDAAAVASAARERGIASPFLYRIPVGARRPGS
jgi:hypothetical protein